MVATIQYTINDNDLVNALYYHFHITGVIRKRILRGRILYGIITLLFIIAISDGGNQPFLFTSILLILIYIIIYPWYLKYVFKKHCRKIIQRSYANVARENQFQLTDSTLIFSSAQGAITYNASGIKDLYETADYFMLFIHGGHVIPLPKADFNHLGEQLKVYCKQHQINFTIDNNWKLN